MQARTQWRSRSLPSLGIPESGSGPPVKSNRDGGLGRTGSGCRGRNWVLAAMIFAVSMTFIDQTIVSIAVPNIQRELGLTSTGVQWMVNGYLLPLAALFAFGGRLADTIGHRRWWSSGSSSSRRHPACVASRPKGSLAEAWIVAFRAIQGVGGALMFPAALAIVVQTFPLQRTGKGSGYLLRDRRRADRYRPAPRRLPDRVDMAGHLLGQHPGGDHRPGPDRNLQA